MARVFNFRLPIADCDCEDLRQRKLAIGNRKSAITLLVLRVQTMSTETPLDLKKTVNLPKTAFAQKANIAQSEPVRLEKWNKLDLYRLIRRAGEGRPKFIMHDGPPYANADIHLDTQ